MGEMRNRCIKSVEKPEGKGPPGKPKHSWKDNIKMNLIEMGRVVGWIHLDQDRVQCRAVVNTVMNLNEKLILGVS
jgi:hypothetical protein